MNFWTALKSVAIGAASLVLLGSDALGIQHNTWAKTAAAAVLSALAAESYEANKTGAALVKKAAPVLNGVASKDD